MFVCNRFYSSVLYLIYLKQHQFYYKYSVKLFIAGLNSFILKLNKDVLLHFNCCFKPFNKQILTDFCEEGQIKYIRKEFLSRIN